MRKPFTRKTVQFLLKRSKGICEVCRVNEAREIHHIIPVADGGKNNITNLAYLCGYCHEYVPGSQPDGYKEEFDIYRRNGGIIWGIYALGFYEAWHSLTGSYSKDYEKMNRQLRKNMVLNLKSIKSLPFRLTSNLEVFK